MAVIIEDGMNGKYAHGANCGSPLHYLHMIGLTGLLKDIGTAGAGYLAAKFEK